MTANCSPSWTLLKINTYIFLLNFSSLYPKANLYLSQCSSFSKSKKQKTKYVGSAGSTVCWSQVSNTQEYGKSSQILETNPSRFKLCGSFYSSGQNGYPIHLVKETAVVRFELFWAKTKHYFFLDSAFYIVFIVLWPSCTLNSPFKEFSDGHSRRSTVSLKTFYTSFVQLVGKLRRCGIF